MADYFTQGIVALPFNEAQETALLAYLDEHHGEDSDYPADFEFERDEGALYVWNEESFDSEAFGAAVAHALDQSGSDDEIEWQVAYTCSKPRPDGFGGRSFRVNRHGFVRLEDEIAAIEAQVRAAWPDRADDPNSVQFDILADLAKLKRFGE